MATDLTYPQYIRALRTKMREALKETQRLDARWDKINGEVNDYLDRSNIYDMVQRNKIKKENLSLKDAFAGGEWWRQKTMFLATVIQTEIAAMKEIGE